ncbi:MAG: TonB family protein [Akkermansia sp.]|nr:TonB family protein [Akkermansia sp.]
MKRMHPGTRLPAPARYRQGWQSMLLTIVMLAALAALGHGLRSISGWHSGTATTMQVWHMLEAPAQEFDSAVQALHRDCQPAETSHVSIAPAEPLLATWWPDISEICTTPEEAPTALPLLEAPEELALPLTASNLRQKARAGATAPKPPAEVAATPTPADITPPAYRQAPPPPYPAALRAARAKGTVRVRILINGEGTPTAVHITGSSGHPEFDAAASAWILKKWRFSPARKAGSPVAGCVNTRVEFILDNA